MEDLFLYVHIANQKSRIHLTMSRPYTSQVNIRLPGIQRVSVRWRLTHRANHRVPGKQVNGGLTRNGSLLLAVQEYEGEDSPTRQTTTSPLTPPMSPSGGATNKAEQFDMDGDVTLYDFSSTDYDLDPTRCMDTGLWSSVFFAQPILKSPRNTRPDTLTPPVTPQPSAALPPYSIFAIKVQTRADAEEVFLHEARILTRLQQSQNAYQFIVPFHGLDTRNSSLVFEGLLGGSLEGLSSRLKVMTEFPRHLEARNLFPKLAIDLVSGLHFIHKCGVVHADIKPGNILLGIVVHHSFPEPVVRARYIDFSAAFVSEVEDATNAGGTWDFMAPEQLRIQKHLNTPTFASDIWSLGITLLSIIVGGSPYIAACGANLFMVERPSKQGTHWDLREWIPL